MKKISHFTLLSISILGIPLFGFTQKELLLKTVLLNDIDSSLVAYVFKEIDSSFSNSLDLYFTKNMELDSIIQGDYIVEYDSPDYSLIESYDALKSCNCLTYLDNSEIHYFLEKSKIKFYYPYYGNAPYPINDSLSAKYGVAFLNQGCIRDSHYPKEYLIHVEKLLLLKNGENWQQKYREEFKNL